MLFRRLILNALLVGLLAGLVLSLVQILAVNPIIFAAETFEVAEPVDATANIHTHAADGHGHAHTHDSEAWAPEDGWERTGFTVLSNVLAATGFASVLLALMSILQLLGVTRVNVGKGVLWGIAGFTAFFLAPAVGLPPEIPGVEAAALESRQFWWLAAVAGVGLGILMLVFAPRYVKMRRIGHCNALSDADSSSQWPGLYPSRSGCRAGTDGFTPAIYRRFRCREPVVLGGDGGAGGLGIKSLCTSGCACKGLGYV